MQKMTAALGAATMALGLMAGAAPASAATQVVTNGGFETGDFTGWTVGYTPGQNVCCMGFSDTGTHVATAGSNLGAALGGNYSAYGDWDGGDGSAPIDLNLATDFWVRQLLTKTTDVTSATLSFQFQVAGGAYANYSANAGYGGVQKRNVTANFLGADLAPQANLYTYERDLMTGLESYATPVMTVTLDVTAAYNALADGGFYLDFSRHIPQYFTGAGYFVMDNASLVLGDAVVPPDPGGGVPEPGAWALMILGFGGAGSALRRRKAVLAA
jgi:hypothetical protein